MRLDLGQEPDPSRFEQGRLKPANKPLKCHSPFYSVMGYPIDTIGQGETFRNSLLGNKNTSQDQILNFALELRFALDKKWARLNYEEFVNALVQFRSEYSGNLWPEVMLVRGINDSEEALDDIAALMDRSQPDRIFITVPTRPPAETWVMPPDNESLLYAAARLNRFSKSSSTGSTGFVIGKYEDIGDAVLSIVSRHPMSQEELE